VARVRPVVPTAIRTEFGDVLEDASFYDAQGRDVTYVPGYSELRRARDASKGLAGAERQAMSADPDEAAHGQKMVAAISDTIRRNLTAAGLQAPTGKIAPSDVPTLPVRLQWVRTTRVSGAPDSTKTVQYGTEGYTQVTKDDLGKPWLQSLPAGASIGVGGGIHQGDCVLMVCDAKSAARTAAIVQRQTERMVKDSAAGDFLQLGQAVKGTDPTFTSEPGREIKAPPSRIK